MSDPEEIEKPKSEKRAPRRKTVRKRPAKGSAETGEGAEAKAPRGRGAESNSSESGRTGPQKTTAKRGDAPEAKENQRNRDKKTDHGDDKPSKKKSRSRRGRRPSVKVDGKELRKLAREIFLGDVREEGTMMLNQKDAETLAKRSFEVAEIFLREKERRKR